LSVLLRADCQPLTPQQVKLQVSDDVTLPAIIINDGRLLRGNLKSAGYDEKWLKKQLQKEKITEVSRVFLLTVDEQGSVCCIKKEDKL
jgi:uncharacterized membrane protein YcaP (DUF421 family)